MRKTLSEDPFMSRCCARDETCEGRIEWHHAFNYAGKRQNVRWGILPLCSKHHDQAASLNTKLAPVMRSRMTDEEFERARVVYSRADLFKMHGN